LVIWYKASNFDSIATAYCDFEGDQTNFGITKYLDNNGIAVWGWSANTISSDEEVNGHISTDGLTDFTLEGQWNMLGFDWKFDEIDCAPEATACDYVTSVTAYHNDQSAGSQTYRTGSPFADKPDQPFEIGLG
jgi:hypothetical protein